MKIHSAYAISNDLFRIYFVQSEVDFLSSTDFYILIHLIQYSYSLQYLCNVCSMLNVYILLCMQARQKFNKETHIYFLFISCYNNNVISVCFSSNLSQLLKSLSSMQIPCKICTFTAVSLKTSFFCSLSFRAIYLHRNVIE